MGVKSSIKGGSLVIVDPKTGAATNDDEDAALENFSDDSLDSNEFDSEYESVDEGEVSYDEGELRPLSEIWDIEAGQSGSGIVLDQAAEELSEESESESDLSDSDQEDIFGSEDEGEAVELTNVLSSIQDQVGEKQRKKLVNVAGADNELAVPVNGDVLRLSDMMEEQDKPLLLRKKTEAVAVPLPKRVQQRHERSAAYEISKKQVETWKDAVERVKTAEVLDLRPVEQLGKVSVFAPSKGAASELERKVGAVLDQSMLQDTKNEALFEQIETAKLSREEMARRQNELRLMRDLLFREERKARRIKKIKSKSYRKVRKKEMLRNQELVEGEEEEDPEEAEAARAEARMTMKFKNSQSKWAKDMLKHGMTKDKETRAEMETMLLQGQKLREKVLGRAEEELAEELAEEPEPVEVGKTGFMNMKFMKKAQEREKQENLASLELLRRTENGGDVQEFQDVNRAKVVLNQGRRVYTPSAEKAAEELEQQNLETNEEVLIDESKSLQKKLAGRDLEEAEVVTEESNPWLGKEVKKSSKLRVVDENSTRAEKQAYRLLKSKKKDLAVEQFIDTSNTLAVENTEPTEEFEQKEVIKEAFAGDDVVEEFENEKKRTVDEEDDQWVEDGQPGFNNWLGGTVTQRKKQKKKTKKVQGVKARDERRDKKLDSVIINEKVNKRSLKYQSSAVPFPYENKEQYERSLRIPIGQEWTSRKTFQKLTMPSVITKSGTVIKPLSKK